MRLPRSRSCAIDAFMPGSTLLVTKFMRSSIKAGSSEIPFVLPTAMASSMSARKNPRSSGSATIRPMDERRLAVVPAMAVRTMNFCHNSRSISADSAMSSFAGVDKRVEPVGGAFVRASKTHHGEVAGVLDDARRADNGGDIGGAAHDSIGAEHRGKPLDAVDAV